MKDKANAVNFLLYSYFGIAFEDSGDTNKILRLVIDKAYSDATLQGAYNMLKKEGASKENVVKAGRELFNLVKDLLEREQEFDKWHKTACGKLVEIYKDVKIKDTDGKAAFTYGNAQKWVNMTMKYLYILNILFEDDSKFCREYGEKINNLAEYLHIPLDRYIIAATNPKNEKKLDNYLNGYFKNITWSAIDFDEYINYQTAIKTAVKNQFKNIPAIEWENAAWIEASRKGAQENKIIKKSYYGG